MGCAVSIVNTRTVPPATRRRHGIKRKHLYTSAEIVRLHDQAHNRTDQDRARLDYIENHCEAIQ
jgi:hypothetical protein